MFRVLIFVAVSVAFFAVGGVFANADAYQAHMKRGDQFLISGRSAYRDAVAAYTAGIALSPDDPKGYIRRADVYRLLREHGSCLEDLTFVLGKDSRHRKALEMRSKLLLETGKLGAASHDYEALADVYQSSKDHKKMNDALHTAMETRQLGEQLEVIERNRFAHPHDCVHVTGHILAKYVKDSDHLRLLRAECAIFMKDHTVAAEEIRRVLSQKPNHLEALLLNARELRSLGATDSAKKQLRRCLEYDPDNKRCSNLHKAMKLNQKLQDKLKEYLDRHDWGNVVRHIDSMLAEGKANRENPDFEQPALDEVKLQQCEAYFHMKKVDAGLAACDVVLDVRGRDVEASWPAWLWRAELYTVKDDLAAAEAEFKHAKAHGGQQERVHEFERKLEKLKKQASRKNYYKILGVKKDASTAQIKKAFRTLALQYHPDKIKDDVPADKREELGNKYRDISEAKEVLTDPEKRGKFDRGEDVFPNQGGQQQEGGFNPFQHFYQGGGGGFNFHFH